jgi:hypothetical protein
MECKWIASPLHKKGSAEAIHACSTTSKHRDIRRRAFAASAQLRREQDLTGVESPRVHTPASTLASQARSII